MKVHSVLFAILSMALCVSCGPKEPQTIVKTSTGKIEGYFDDGVYAFKAIPYGVSERFQPAQPKTWKGVLECKEYGPWAMSTANAGECEEFTGDHLLNVFTTGVKDGQKRPVIVWLHGGGYSKGSGNSYGVNGEPLAKKGVVCVTVNHRLDILGYMDLSSFGGKWAECVNLGQRDLILALKWTKANAALFGGDPDNITIYGESGGGGKVGSLLCMPEAHGLFQKAIVQSGAGAGRATSEQSQKIGEAVVAALGLTAETLDQIQAVPFDELVAAAEKALKPAGWGMMMAFGPTMDGKHMTHQPYSPDFAEFSKDIPLIIGSTFNELQRVYYADETLDLKKAKEMLNQRYECHADEFIAAFNEAYPDATPADYVSIDTGLRSSCVNTASAHSRTAPVYNYLYTWTADTEKGHQQGSYHGMDISMAFNLPVAEGNTVDPNDPQAIKLADRISDCWVNFCKTGNPSIPDCEWLQYTEDNRNTLIMDNEFVIRKDLDNGLMKVVSEYSVPMAFGRR